MAVVSGSKIYAAGGITLQDSMKIRMTGKFDIYAKRQAFMLTTIQIAGEGDLRQRWLAFALKSY